MIREKIQFPLYPALSYKIVKYVYKSIIRIDYFKSRENFTTKITIYNDANNGIVDTIVRLTKIKHCVYCLGHKINKQTFIDTSIDFGFWVKTRKAMNCRKLTLTKRNHVVSDNAHLSRQHVSKYLRTKFSFQICRKT